MTDKTTGELMKLLTSIKNTSELKQYTDTLSNARLFITFPEYISEQMRLHHMTASLTLSKNGQLYSKNKRDSILIFALEKKLSVMDANELLQEMGEPLLL